ncbi:MAG: hypothetical protein QM755_06100 [Luteolibacter sp.]
MELQEASAKRWDTIGTVLAAVTLVAGFLILIMASSIIGISKMEFGNVEELNLPVAFKIALSIHGFYGFQVVALLLLSLGIRLLIRIKDRLRANLYGALVGVVLSTVGGLTMCVAELPLLKAWVSIMQAR